MKSIFDHAMLGALPAKNRLVLSATGHLYQSEDGIFQEAFYGVYEQLAKGGVGTIIVELADMVKNRNNDALIPQYRRLTDMIHGEQVNTLLQIGLVDFYDDGDPYPTDPTDMTAEQIRKTVALFAETAARAKAGGFDGVQIHAGHFLFLSQFISPALNERTDEYGGNAENRSRILLDILQAIRKTAPGLHVSIKLNFHDFTRGGLQPQDSIQIAKWLTDAGIDSIEVTANGSSRPGIKAGINEGYFYEYGKALAEQVNVPVILVGGHRSAAHMDKLLNDSHIAFFSLCRPLIREPDLVNRWQSGDLSPAKCVSCNGCYRTGHGQCVFNLDK